MAVDTSTFVSPPGSLILVTGANGGSLSSPSSFLQLTGPALALLLPLPGFIASHVVNEALKLGYRVRGTVRAAPKLGRLTETWETSFPGMFEVAIVEDAEKEGAYDQVMKGVSGVAHVSAVAGTFPSSAEEASRIVTNMTLSCLRSAAREPSVKRFVLTSSVTAACRPLPNLVREVGQETWNDKAKDLAKEEGPGQAFFAYMASKAEGEKAAWAYAKEEQPSFELFTCLPDMNVGALLEPKVQGSSGAMLLSLWNNEPDNFVKQINGIAYIAVTDTALLHLGALLLPSLTPQRLFGCGGSVNVNEYLDLFALIDPSRKVPDKFPGMDGKDLSIYDTKGAVEVLRRMKGSGTVWKELETAVRECVLGQT
ncbi:hypothetical protein JCM11251_003260 [Rhodosporidiobolus azoricus]